MYPFHLKGVVVKSILVGIYMALSWFRDIQFPLSETRQKQLTAQCTHVPARTRELLVKVQLIRVTGRFVVRLGGGGGRGVPWYHF